MTICDGTNPLRKPTLEESEAIRATKKATRVAVRKAAEKAAGIGAEAHAERQAIAPKRKFRIMAKQNWCCYYCGAPFGKPHPQTGEITTVHMDHKVSIAHGGSNDDENLVAACQGCNLGKGRASVTNKKGEVSK